MPDSAFDQLAEDAAAGLKGDQELFLDVKQELCAHLEDKADALRAQGHSEEESDDLARKAFGSPLAVAAELVAANAGRMNRRALARLAFLVVVMPLAVVLALYVGYQRFVGLSCTLSVIGGNVGDYSIKQLPALPGATHIDNAYESKASLVQQLAGSSKNAANLYHFWENHRHDPDAKMYYAYYAIFVPKEFVQNIRGETMPIDPQYVAAMRKGEQVEPQNALYNILLAEYYLQNGINIRSDLPMGHYGPPTDEILDRRAFTLGMTELRKALAKPYLHTYRARILQMKLNALPTPLFTEEYLGRIMLAVHEIYPEMVRYRNLAWQISACARVLRAEGCLAEAEAMMDTWQPYTTLLMSDASTNLYQSSVACSGGEVLSKEGAEVYDQLGITAKARKVRAINARLKNIDQQRRFSKSERMQQDDLFQKHGAYLAAINRARGVKNQVLEADLQPLRMHEHAMIDEMLVEGVVLLLILALLVVLLDGAIWFVLRWERGSRPLLLLSANELFRALLLGIALPVAVYWVYSRLPVIGGREYSWSGHWPRFAIEWLLLAIALLWLPSRSIRRYIDRRCAELGIMVPARKQVWWILLRTWAILLTAVVIGVLPALLVPESDAFIWTGGLLVIILLCVAFYAYSRTRHWPLLPRIAILVLAIGLGEVAAYSMYSHIINIICLLLASLLVVVSMYSYRRVTNCHARYHGTVALSLAPLFAFSALFLSLVVQPWFIANEVYWLRQDSAFLNHMSQSHQRPVGFSASEEQANAYYQGLLEKAMKEGR